MAASSTPTPTGAGSSCCLDAKVAEKGLAIVPLKMYFNEDGRVKVELALARGKKLYDKRASMKERDTKREIDRALKERVR